MPKISLDDVEFNSEDLTEGDQRIFASLQFVEAKITSLKNERSVLNASKLFYEQQIRRILAAESVQGFMLTQNLFEPLNRNLYFEMLLFQMNRNLLHYHLLSG